MKKKKPIESILPLCNLTEKDRKMVKENQEALAQKGYRVIAVGCRREMNSTPKSLEENILEFVGLIGFADPPREAVPEAIRVCNRAGIRVVMITGDNGTTAQSIARQIGISNSENILTGKELEAMPDVARVIPSHKMRIVKALKDTGEIVAMTGDGVNDAPALKYADIGIAMGKRGTGVAREAADMILLDDNFITIVDTVKDGRRIYDNIKKAIGYVFVIHIPIALTALFTPLLNLPLLLLPIHVVLLELIIDPICAIVFERQPAEKDVMDRSPRPLKESLITAGLLAKSVLQGLIIFGASFGTYVMMNRVGAMEELARTITMAILVFANLFLVYVNQSNQGFALSAFIKSTEDKVLCYVNGGILVGLLLIIYLPGANSMTKTTPLSWLQLLASFGIAAAATLWWEVVKWIKRS